MTIHAHQLKISLFQKDQVCITKAKSKLHQTKQSAGLIPPLEEDRILLTSRTATENATIRLTPQTDEERPLIGASKNCTDMINFPLAKDIIEPERSLNVLAINELAK